MEMLLYVYKVKIYDGINKHKQLVAAENFLDATLLADKLSGPNGYIIWVKDINKEVTIWRPEETI